MARTRLVCGLLLAAAVFGVPREMSRPERVGNILTTVLVSVIVPLRGRPDGLRACLAAIEGQLFAAGDFEVIVVARDADPVLHEVIAASSHARLIQETDKCSYEARNRGLELAHGEVFAFTHANAVPAADWLSHGVASLEESPGHGLVGGRIDVTSLLPDRPNAVEVYETLFGYRQKEMVETWHNCSFANAFTRRSLVEELGPFNVALVAGAGAEWTKRILTAGYKSAYVDGARVSLPARRNIVYLLRHTVRTAAGMYEIEQGVRDDLNGLWYRRPPHEGDIDRLKAFPGISNAKRAAVLALAVSLRLAIAAERLRLRADRRRER